MDRTIPMDLDAPEKQQIIVGLIYSFFAFWVLPFLLLLINGGFHYKRSVLSGFELAFHLLNLVVALSIFKEYLSFSWLTVICSKKKIFSTVLLGLALMLALAVNLEGIRWLPLGNIPDLAAESMFPITEVDALITNRQLVRWSPVFGTICVVLVTPVTIGCLFYGTIFPAFFNIKPWLGYVAAAVMAAFPCICSLWSNDTLLVIYLARLPVHLIACWTMQRTDTVFTPVFTLMGANLLSCIWMLLSSL